MPCSQCVCQTNKGQLLDVGFLTQQPDGSPGLCPRLGCGHTVKSHNGTTSSDFEQWKNSVLDVLSATCKKTDVDDVLSDTCKNTDVDDVLSDVDDVGENTDVDEDNRGWRFATPVTPSSPFQADPLLMEQLKENLTSGQNNEDKNTEEEDGIVFVATGCRGIGKSRLCDEAAALLLPNENDVALVKVTYHVVPRSLGDYFPGRGFLWRVIAGAYGAVNPEFTLAHVLDFLEAVYENKIPIRIENALAMLECLLSKQRHWILAVDDIALARFDPITEQEVFEYCSAFAHRTKSRYAFVTSRIPKREIHVKTVHIPLRFLSAAACFQISTALGPQLSRSEQEQAVVLSGGHPRSLVSIPTLMCKNGRCPSPREVAMRSFSRFLFTNQIMEIYKLSFTPKPFDLLPEHIRSSIQGGTLHFALCSPSTQKGWVMTPAPFLADATDAGPEAAFAWMQHILRLNPMQSFQFYVFASEQMKSLAKLPMLQPEGELKIAIPSQQATHKACDWSTLTLTCEAKVLENSSVFQSNKNGFVEVDPVYKQDTEHMLICPDRSHPYIGGQFMVTSADSQLVKVLFVHQFKGNEDLQASVQGLNEAARLLQNHGWTGPFCSSLSRGNRQSSGTRTSTPPFS